MNHAAGRHDASNSAQILQGVIMSHTAGSLRALRPILAGLVLTLTVPLATAAMVMYMPASPVVVEPARNAQMQAMNEYVQLHRTRSAMVPNDMTMAVTTASN